jgi:NADH-quinone oxidoreductase subunit G
MEIVRILPQINDDINQEWLSDKGRFSCDGLKYQRLDRPYAKIHGKLQEVSWQKALDIFKFQMGNFDSQQLAAIPGGMLDCESMFGFKELLRGLGFSNIAKNQFNHQFDVTSRANYLFNTGIAGIDQADFCLLIGANPRHNAPVLNARIGSNARAGKLCVARLGYEDDQTYKIDELGQDLEVLNQILAGQHRLSQQLISSVKPMIIIGDGIYSRTHDAVTIKSLVKLICEKYGFIKEDWNGFNVLHNDAGSVGLLDLGFGDGCDVNEIFHAAGQGEIKLVYLLDADEFDMSQLGHAFVVYQGHHGDKGASRADLILPATAYTERDGIYVNTEGRPQYSRSALAALLHAKDNTQIFIDIAKSMNLQLPFSHPSQVRSKMLEKYPHLMPDDNYRFSVNGQLNFAVKADVNVIGEKLSKIENHYYMNNVISRASPTMLDCAKFILGLNNE